MIYGQTEPTVRVPARSVRRRRRPTGRPPPDLLNPRFAHVFATLRRIGTPFSLVFAKRPKGWTRKSSHEQFLSAANTPRRGSSGDVARCCLAQPCTSGAISRRLSRRWPTARDE